MSGIERTIPKGDMGEAVNVFFDRIDDLLPVWVGRGPAILISICVAIIVFVLGFNPINEDRVMNQTSPNPLDRFRWVIFLGILLFVTAMVQEFVADKVYTISMFKKNSQHFANVFWLSKYAKAAKNGCCGSM